MTDKELIEDLKRIKHLLDKDYNNDCFSYEAWDIVDNLLDSKIKELEHESI